MIKGLTLTAGEALRPPRCIRSTVMRRASLAAAWGLNDNRTLLRASFGQGFKAPSLYQLYSNYGNPGLRPELAESWDAGVEQHAWDGRLILSATYFRQQQPRPHRIFLLARRSRPVSTPRAVTMRTLRERLPTAWNFRAPSLRART